MVEGPTGGAVHAGFANAFSGVGSKVRKWLDNHRGMQVIVTGHSLGGALATLSASQWAASRLVTFGSPRVGNVAFVGTVRAEAVARYVDCCDIVTRVPPETPWYTHVGATMYIDSAGQLRTSMTQEKIEADRTRARIDYLRDEAWRTGTVLVRDLADHAPINYERALFPPCEAGWCSLPTLRFDPPGAAQVWAGIFGTAKPPQPNQCRGQGQLRVLSPLWLIRDDDRCGGSATEPSSDPAATGLPWGTSYRVEVCADAETRSITTSTLPDALSAKAQFSVGHGEGA
jgi:hypothetical protein